MQNSLRDPWRSKLSYAECELSPRNNSLKKIIDLSINMPVNSNSRCAFDNMVYSYFERVIHEYYMKSLKQTMSTPPGMRLVCHVLPPTHGTRHRRRRIRSREKRRFARVDVRRTDTRIRLLLEPFERSVTEDNKN